MFNNRKLVLIYPLFLIDIHSLREKWLTPLMLFMDPEYSGREIGLTGLYPFYGSRVLVTGKVVLIHPSFFIDIYSLREKWFLFILLSLLIYIPYGKCGSYSSFFLY